MTQLKMLTNNKPYNLVFISIFVALLVMSFGFQGSRSIWQPDEGYYTGTAVTMMKKNTLLIPYLGEDEIFLDKPPMIYWGIIAGLKLLGHNEFAVRFFHGLSFFLTSITVGLLSYSMFKEKLLAMLTSLIYATMVVPFFAANFVTPDTILAFWTALACLCFWNSSKSTGKTRILWQMMLCASVGFGFLAKGPAAIIPCSGMFIFLLIRKEMLQYFLTKWSILGVFIFTIIGLSWYIWISFNVSGGLNYLFESQISGRLITEKFNRNPGLIGALIYVPVLLFGSLPWSTIWIEKIKLIKSSIFTTKWWRNLLIAPEKLFLLCYFFVPLAILCLASSKLGLYALPIFTPLAITLAKFWIIKIPKINNLSQKDLIKSIIHPVRLTIIWIILLLLAKFSLLYYPTQNDMEKLGNNIKQHLTQSNYELCTIDKRADGLLFYGLDKIEHLTKKLTPYPTFTKKQTVLEEIQDLIIEKENGVFLTFEDKNLKEVTEILKKADIRYKIQQLPDQWALIYPDLENKINLDN